MSLLFRTVGKNVCQFSIIFFAEIPAQAVILTFQYLFNIKKRFLFRVVSYSQNRSLLSHLPPNSFTFHIQ